MVAYRARGLRYARDHAGRLPLVMLAREGRLLDLYRPWTQGVFFNASEGRNPRASKAGAAVLLAAAAVRDLRRGAAAGGVARSCWCRWRW